MSRGPKDTRSSSELTPGRPRSDFEETARHKAASVPETMRAAGIEPEHHEETQTETIEWRKGVLLDKTQRMAAVTAPLPAHGSGALPRIAPKAEEVTSTIPIGPPLSVRPTPASGPGSTPPAARDVAASARPAREVRVPAVAPNPTRRLKVLWASLFIVVAAMVVVFGILVRTALALREDAARKRAAVAQTAPTSPPRTVSAIAVDNAPAVSGAAPSEAADAAPSAAIDAGSLAATTTTAAAAPAAAPSASASSSSSSSSSSPRAEATSGDAGPAIDPDMGVVIPAHNVWSRRVWIDGRLAGQTPEHFTVKCGKHKIKVGSEGETATVDVPCGGEINVK